MLEAVHNGDRNAVLEANYEQSKELADSDETVTCPCGASGRVKTAYRCFYCDVFFCPSCASDHFNDNTDGSGGGGG